MELFKLRVQNLGRIADAELSIRPLTVFIGPNNTNKTWTAYALYALAKWLSGSFANLWRRYHNDGLVRLDHQIELAIASSVIRLTSLLSRSQEASTLLEELVREDMLKDIKENVRLVLLRTGLSRVLAVPEDIVRNSTAELEMTRAQFMNAIPGRLALELQSRGSGHQGVFTDRDGTSRLWFVQAGMTPATEQGTEAFLQSFVGQLLLWRFSGVYALPAERKALVTLNRLLQPSFTNLLTQPVADFVSMLTEAEAEASRPAVPYGFPDVASSLERSLLRGKLAFDQANTPLMLTYLSQSGPNLKMHASSSLIRALAGLDVYLRNLAREGDLIVIDEPEMNAHPEAQLMITELLGILVNKGINVVITTHSPYVVDHINNLVEAATLPKRQQDEIARRFKLQTKEAFIPSENVSTYLFSEGGTVTDTFDREDRIINWDTFGGTSDYVSNVYGKILELQPQG